MIFLDLLFFQHDREHKQVHEKHFSEGNGVKPNLKKRVEEATEAAVAAFEIDFPAHGQVRASNELRKQGVFVSPSGVRSVWLRAEKDYLRIREAVTWQSMHCGCPSRRRR